MTIPSAGEQCLLEEYAAFAWNEHQAVLRSASIPRISGAAPADRIPMISRPIQRKGSATAPANIFEHDPDDGQTAEVLLDNLLGDGSLLDGTYVKVRSDRLDPPNQPATGKNGTADFRFEPNLNPDQNCIFDIQHCSPFDAVNVYYHIDKVAREFWIDRMGVDVDFKVDASTHISGDGGFANPRENVLKFGVGNIFMDNSALQDDVIYHEYSHLVTASLGFLVDVGASDQTRALNEGYADYFAATYTDDPRIGEWVVECPPRRHCEGPQNDDEFRTIDLEPTVWNWNEGQPSDTLRYGFCLRFHEGDRKCKASYNNFANHYVWGMIWGGALWHLRESLGADVTDPIILQAIGLHDPSTVIDEALMHLIQADRIVHGGSNETVIQEVFAERGFMVPLVGAAEDDALPSKLRVDLYPNPAASSVHLGVTIPVVDAVQVRIFDLLARVVLDQNWDVSPVGRRVLDLSVEHLPPGFYLADVEVGGTREAVRFIIAR